MLTPKIASFYGRYSYLCQLPAEILMGAGADTALLGIFLLGRFFQPSKFDLILLFALNHTSFLLTPYITARLRHWSAHWIGGLMFLLAVPALCSAVGIRLYQRLRVRREESSLRAKAAEKKETFVGVYRELARLFRENPKFSSFEIGYRNRCCFFLALSPASLGRLASSGAG